MGRPRRVNPPDLRPEWIYVGRQEAAVLSGLPQHILELAILSGDLKVAELVLAPDTGRRRQLYRLSAVLALARRRSP